MYTIKYKILSSNKLFTAQCFYDELICILQKMVTETSHTFEETISVMFALILFLENKTASRKYLCTTN